MSKYKLSLDMRVSFDDIKVSSQALTNQEFWFLGIIFTEKYHVLEYLGYWILS